jgi:HAD superfamily hydrolase (TIGR01490 family)
MTALAIYDMDRTITRRGTYTGFLFHVALRRSPWRLILAPFALLVMAAYACRMIDRSKLKEINQLLLTGGHIPSAELAPLARGFAARTVATNIYPGALRQMAADRESGHRLIMATASYRIYVTAIAEALGMDEVIATDSFCLPDGRIQARIEGENCYGPAKLRKIQAWLATQGLDRPDCTVRFYSDHVSDAPVLDWADVPIAVNPSPKLRRLAKGHGWLIVDWSR